MSVGKKIIGNSRENSKAKETPESEQNQYVPNSHNQTEVAQSSQPFQITTDAAPPGFQAGHISKKPVTPVVDNTPHAAPMTAPKNETAHMTTTIDDSLLQQYAELQPLQTYQNSFQTPPVSEPSLTPTAEPWNNASKNTPKHSTQSHSELHRIASINNMQKKWERPSPTVYDEGIIDTLVYGPDGLPLENPTTDSSYQTTHRRATSGPSSTPWIASPGTPSTHGRKRSRDEVIPQGYFEPQTKRVHS